MTALDLDAIKARVDAATVGPWVMTTQGGIESASYRGPGEFSASVAATHTVHDWEFIAHARMDVPALVAEVERLRAATGIRDSIVFLNAWLSGVEAELWEKRADPYFLGKHDGVIAALNRLNRIIYPESSDSSSTGGGQ